ncbi:MAG TPA: hypothetical protein VIS04_04100 [Woeseiaceae bacterium]
MTDLTREDEWLRKVFHQETLADDGFSEAVMRRVRRRRWARRWTMPISVLIGTVIAAKPAIELLVFVNSLFGEVLSKAELLSVPSDWVTQSASFMVAGALLVFGGIFLSALQD